MSGLINRKRIFWISRTAVFIALLVAWQALSVGGGQFVTGSGVNLILIAATMTCGYATGVSVAVVSNFMAYMVGVGPGQILLIPFICIANVVIVTLWHFIANINLLNKHIARIIAAAAGALGKFAALYFGIVKFAAPVILELPENSPIFVMMSYPQLITASIGGAAACIVLPLLDKALSNPAAVTEDSDNKSA